MARGVSSSAGEDPTKQSISEVTHEDNKSNSWIFCVAATVTIAVAFSGRLAGQTASVKSSGESSGSGTAMERASGAD